MIFIIFLPFVMAVLMRIFCKNQRKLALNTLIFVGLIEIIATLLMILNDNIGANIENITIKSVSGLGLNFYHNGFRGVMGILTSCACFVTSFYSKQHLGNDKKTCRYVFYNLLTLGATLGIFYSGDFFTLFFFFEMMSLTSFVWVIHKETEEARYAGGTYLGISIAGGLSILMGVFLVNYIYGTLNFQTISKIVVPEDKTTLVMVAAGCMFAGFGAKASAFPVHVWLPNAYTQAPAPASALLSAILSKTGVFGIIAVTWYLLPGNANWGMFIIITGLITMVVGGVRAVLCTNIKTTIAYSSMSQIGFILVGVGMQAMSMLVCEESYRLAVNGTVLHMFNHSVIKLILFMVAGIVFYNIGSYDINVVRGFGRKKTFLLVTFALGAAGISGIVFLNGYVSKTLLHESIVEYMNYYGESINFKYVEYIFLFSGGLTVCYMLKLFMALFVEKNADDELQAKYDGMKNYLQIYSKVAISLCCIPVVLLGILPKQVAEGISSYAFNLEIEFKYLTFENLLGSLISITTGVVLYLVVVRKIVFRKSTNKYINIWPKWIDLEKYVYRCVLYKAIPVLLGIISKIMDSIVDTIVVILRKTIYRDLALPYELPEGNKVTHNLGVSLERISQIKCAINKTTYNKKDYEHKLALKRLDILENAKIIERSLSFGLFMFCCGLVMTLIYLMIVN